MPSQTPALAVPYPLPEDALVDYPALGAQLASKIEALLGRALGVRSTDVVANTAVFGSGPRVLATPLSFHADGVTSYAVKVLGPGLVIATGNAMATLWLELDAAQSVAMQQVNAYTGGAAMPCNGIAVITPAVGNHTVNVVLLASTGSVTAKGNPSSGYSPILVTVEALHAAPVVVTLPGPEPDEPEAAPKLT